VGFPLHQARIILNKMNKYSLFANFCVGCVKYFDIIKPRKKLFFLFGKLENFRLWISYFCAKNVEARRYTKSNFEAVMSKLNRGC
jgi:hypothetical protein